MDRSRFVEGNTRIFQNKGYLVDWETFLSTVITNVENFVQELALTSINGGALDKGLVMIN